jgi:glutamate racemase
MATRGTLGSTKFRTLVESLAGQADFICQPCDGLADAIERQDTIKTIALCAHYTGAIGQFGTQDGQIDTLVLGCTHYPFASEHLIKLLGSELTLIDNGAPVARQTRRMLTTHALGGFTGRCRLYSTGNGDSLQKAAQHWLGLDGPIELL